MRLALSLFALGLMALFSTLVLAAPTAVYLEDDFSGGGTKYFSEENIDGRAFRYAGGEYEIDTTQGTTYGQSVLLDDLATYRLQATGRLVSSTESNGGGFGLSFNYREGGGSPNFMLFLVYDRGAYTILRYFNDKTDVLFAPARTKLFKPGEPVTLTVDSKRFDGLITSITAVSSSTTFEVEQSSSIEIGDYIQISTAAGPKVAKVTNKTGSTVTVDTTITNMTVGSTIRSGGVQLVFYINGVESATLLEADLTSGGYGMFTTAKSVARFDDFRAFADHKAPAGGFSDEFDGEKVLYEGDWGEVGYRYEGGRYLIDTAGTDYIGLSPFPEPLLSFEFSADVELVSGGAPALYGLYIRDYANPGGAFNQYRFLLSGRYYIVERSVDDRPLALSESVESDAIKPGANRLKVRADGGELVFSINDREVYRLRDEAPHAGAFGFFAGGGTVAAFDNARLVPMD